MIDPTTVTDPVCGMKVDPATSKHHVRHAGTTFHFCSAGCRAKFEADPATYLTPKPPPPPANTGAIYTCLMHSEICQHGSGSCPICGMALYPLEFTAEAPPNHELIDMTIRYRGRMVRPAAVFRLPPWLPPSRSSSSPVPAPRAWPRRCRSGLGRQRRRRRRRRPDRVRRSAATPGAGRHHRHRQDRHPDRGQTVGHRHRHHTSHLARLNARPDREPGTRQRGQPGDLRRRRLRLDHRPGRHRHGRRPLRHSGQTQV